MENTEAKLKFDECIAAFYSSRLVIVERTIGVLLKNLASDPELMHVVGESASSTSYPSEYALATEGGVFKMPATGNKRVVGLTVGLLLQFDKHELSVIDFVTRYFPAPTSHESYTAFLDAVIRPFHKAFIALLNGENAIAVTEGAPEVRDESLPDNVKEEIAFWLKSLMQQVFLSDGADEGVRSDASDALKGMMYTLEFDNPLLIKVVWIAVRYTLGALNMGFRELNSIFEILRNYGITD